MQLINGNSLWPTYADFDFSENCGLYNKVYNIIMTSYKAITYQFQVKQTIL